MIFKLKCLLVTLSLTFLTGAAPGICAMNEKSIQPGWELSATLALFRNLPFIDSALFPASQGDVYFSQTEDFKLETEQVFTNTYRFYRATTDGKFMAITVVEEQKMGETPEGSYYLRVADLDRSLAIVDALPEGTDVLTDLSTLLSYIFDNRAALLVSKAGEFARQLNYGKEGRIRNVDYHQPRVSFFEDPSGKLEKVRIYGVASLLSQVGAISESPDLECQVLEVSVDDTGAANASLTSLLH
jgi:hypothetical protein